MSFPQPPASLSYTTVDEVKYESSLINQTFVQYEVENKISEAENLVNQFTGKTRTSPWLNTDDLWESVRTSTRMLASALLLGKYSNRSVDAKAKMDAAIKFLKINFHVADAQTDSQTAAVFASGSYEVDTFAAIIKKSNLWPYDIDSDLQDSNSGTTGIVQ